GARLPAAAFHRQGHLRLLGPAQQIRNNKWGRTPFFSFSLAPVTDSRALAFGLLALANLFWAGNWVMGRALRDAFDPVTLNFWRWTVAVAAMAPFALRGLGAQLPLVRRHLSYLALLAFLGVALFQSLVYLG